MERNGTEWNETKFCLIFYIEELFLNFLQFFPIYEILYFVFTVCFTTGILVFPFCLLYSCGF